MIGKLDEALSFHQTALRIRAQRQELIAGNIANADTPNFKAKDVDFSAAFKNAMAGAAPVTSSNGLVQTASNHLSAQPLANALSAGLPGGVQYRNEMQGSVDGNTVDMDVERNQFADNAVRYEASIVMLNGQLKKLMSAIQGQ
ncbi:MAG: flagellar basal body rod protein FlgB [Nitrosomonadales bacterium]|nr:flagellar basal body rod protein FlgB [Nitrosomonadales bacterium]